MVAQPDDLLCPSAQPDMDGARVFAIVGGTPETPSVGYLAPGVEIDAQLLAAVAPLPATRVFRFVAKCEQARCSHYDAGRCSLAARIVEQMPEVVDVLPVCQVRAGCRWYAEHGGVACRRCPQVVTLTPKRDDVLNRVAVPESR